MARKPIALVLFGLLAAGLVTEFRRRRRIRYQAEFAAAEKHVRVQIRGQQFKWYARYSGPDQRFGTPDDFVSHQIFVPRNTPVAVQLRTRDVAHTFYLHQQGIRQAIYPDRTTSTWFVASELSGAPPHSFALNCMDPGICRGVMRCSARVVPPKEFQAWVAKQVQEEID